MMNKENYHNQDAIDKLKELVDSIDMGMLCTHPDDTRHVHAIPMSTQEVDDKGNIWFLFSSESETYRNLQRDKTICLLYANPGSYQFLSIHGNTEVSKDQERIDKYWSNMMKTWFEGGKEDSNLLVLKVIPAEAHYWDTKSNKLVTVVKTAINSIADEPMEIGRCGDLKI